MPDWRERHVPDIGIALVELLAYVGDHLSYYQDAVATEAYLGRRGADLGAASRAARRLRMHEGATRGRGSRRDRSDAVEDLKPDRMLFLTRLPGEPSAARGVVSTRNNCAASPPSQYQVFEPVEPSGGYRALQGPQPDPVLHVGRPAVLPGLRRDVGHAAEPMGGTRRATARRQDGKDKSDKDRGGKDRTGKTSPAKIGRQGR